MKLKALKILFFIFKKFSHFFIVIHTDPLVLEDWKSFVSPLKKPSLLVRTIPDQDILRTDPNTLSISPYTQWSKNTRISEIRLCFIRGFSSLSAYFKTRDYRIIRTFTVFEARKWAAPRLQVKTMLQRLHLPPKRAKRTKTRRTEWAKRIGKQCLKWFIKCWKMQRNESNSVKRLKRSDHKLDTSPSDQQDPLFYDYYI